MANAMDVVDYFLSKASVDEDSNLTNLKVQKLLYYVQGFHLAIEDTELFPETIEAWRYGPVCPEIYHELKSYGANAITKAVEGKDFTKIFSQEQRELVDEIYEVFGQYSAWKLRDMTHEEPTWINNQDSASEITQDEMKEYFKTRLK